MKSVRYPVAAFAASIFLTTSVVGASQTSSSDGLLESL